MKSHIFGMFSVCALTIGLMSCSSNEDTEAPANDVLTQNVEKYGTRSSEVSLQFGASKIAATRAADVNGNMWGDIMPAYPTDDEKQGILDYVRKNPGATVEWPGYTYYFVQDVIGAHHKYSNGAQYNDIDGTAHLDLLEVLEANRTLQPWEKDDKGNPYSWVDLYTHVNNFNNGQCNNAATHNATLMTDGFKAARAHDNYGNTLVDDWRLYYWNGNYYLGLDYKMTKDDGKIDPDGIYDDWIVKILPGKGETPVVPKGEKDDQGDQGNQDDQSNQNNQNNQKALSGEVEFDIHQQKHTDWNEIKTSIHVRDTAAVHVFLPIPIESQAVADDFHIRAGENYENISYTEKLNAKFKFAEQEFSFPVEIKHSTAGIDILIDCTTDEAKAALKLARGVFGDGITFEIHSYVNPDVATDQIWNWLKTVKLPSTKTSQWPEEGDICTHVHGQVSSAYYKDEKIKFDSSVPSQAE